MPRPASTNPKPVVKPTATILVGLIVLFAVLGVALLVVGTTEQHTVGAFFFLALIGSTLTFGLLGATGMVKTRSWQVGGSAGVFVVILGLLLQFARQQTGELKGIVYLDGNIVQKATVILLETELRDNEQNIEPNDHGRFKFPLAEKRKEYKLSIRLPNLRETNVVVKATRGWLQLEFHSRDFAASNDTPTDFFSDCKADEGSCTLFLFDYLREQIGGDEFEAFQNFQTDRLDKGLRNYLASRNLLEDVDFQVKRCSTSISNRTTAVRAATTLKVPAVIWGFIKKQANQRFTLATTITLDRQALNLASREELGDDVTELAGLRKPLTGTPLAIATLVVGDLYLKQGKTNLAQRAFVHAQELVGQLDPGDKEDFARVVENRLQQVQRSNSALVLTPIGGAP